MIRTVEPFEAFEEVGSGDKLVLLAFIRPTMDSADQVRLLEAASRKYADRVRCIMYTQRNLETGMRHYVVSGTPSYLLFHRGGEVDRLIGVSDEETLDSFLDGSLWVK
ncbi:YbbN family protein [Salidesulfovibrio brasiliensis]|uniref:thioredoxin family protein n=1 Tax=Salidesulfovibrio brasiliensis TaxID=221711 RepID=UPI0006D0C338|nr:thioredoxin family protein [Salidesulfovibrio brasiliensis]